MLKTVLKDLFKVSNPKYEADIHIEKALEWLSKAQKITGSGGVSAWYRFDKGWAPPFIETTGYIITTFLESYQYYKDKNYFNKSLHMADFLVDMQLPNGGYRTYVPEVSENPSPTIFNTSQDLSGMCDIYSESKNKKYLNSAKKATTFLINNLNSKGEWINYSYDGKSHSYDVKVAHALLKFYRISGYNPAKIAAIKNLNMALKYQQKNGWFKKAELPGYNWPITHTIAYTIEGMFDSGKILGKEIYINSAVKAATNILYYYEKHDFMPASFDSSWSSDDTYSCLSGNAQISAMWSKIYIENRNKRFFDAAKKINSELKTTQDCKTKNQNILGGIKGSQPIYGEILKNKGYCRLAYINWATKYFADALLLEKYIIGHKKYKYV